MKKHFDNLGLPITATKTEVKRAYRKLAMQLHPDRNPNPNAEKLFSELQNSYEVILHYLDHGSHSFVAQNVSEKRKEKSKEERMKEAKKRYYEQKKREHLETEKYFKKLTQGRRGKIFKVGSVVCAILSFVILLDLLLPHRLKKDAFTAWNKKEVHGLNQELIRGVNLERQGHLFVAKPLFNDVKNYPTCYVSSTRILHLPSKIIHPVEDQLQTYRIDFSVGSVLGFAFLFFLIPLIILYYRKRSPAFTAIYLFSMYIVFPLAFLFLVTNYTWLHILSLGFL